MDSARWAARGGESAAWNADRVDWHSGHNGAEVVVVVIEKRRFRTGIGGLAGEVDAFERGL